MQTLQKHLYLAQFQVIIFFLLSMQQLHLIPLQN